TGRWAKSGSQRPTAGEATRRSKMGPRSLHAPKPSTRLATSPANERHLFCPAFNPRTSRITEQPLKKPAIPTGDVSVLSTAPFAVICHRPLFEKELHMSDAFDADAFNRFEHHGWETNSADAYQEAFGPITSLSIDDLLNDAAVHKGGRLLDVATGPGYVAGGGRARGARGTRGGLSAQTPGGAPGR